MLPDPRYGPAAQTPAQRAQVLWQMKQTFPRLRRASACVQPLFGRYVAGEISWLELCALRDARAPAY